MDRAFSEQKYSSTIIRQMFLTLLPSQIIACIASTIGNIVNGLLVGNFLSAGDLVALGFVNPLLIVWSAVSSILCVGARILCGRYIGRGEMKKVDATFTTSVICGGVSGAVLTAAGLFAAPALAALLGDTGETAASTAAYIRGLSIGALPTIFVPLLMTFLQMFNDISYSLTGTVLLTAGSVAFAFMNIFVFHGGVFGMGAATSAAQTVTLLFLIARFVMKKDLPRLSRDGFSFAYTAELLKLGSSGGVAGICYAIRNAVINTMAFKTGGTFAVSVLSILNSSVGIFDAFNVAVGNVALMLMSVYIGERNSASMKKFARICIQVGCALAFMKIAVIFLFSGQIAAAFGATGRLVTETHLAYCLYSLCMPVNIFMCVLLGVYQGMGRVLYSNLVYLVNALLLPVAWVTIMSRLIGNVGVWSTYLAADVLFFVVLALILTAKYHRFPRTADDWMMLDAMTFSGARTSAAARSVEEVIGFSQGLMDFCRENGIDSRRAYLCTLCVEEMASNVIKHGFPKGKRRDYTVDMFVLCDGGELILRIMDNAPAFDPRTKFAITPEDAENIKGFGIRLVAKVAKEFSYQTTFGMNVVSIKL